MASENCFSIVMPQAMERHKHGEVRVIPIILRYCNWEAAPFGNISVLPTNKDPVVGSPSHNQDEAFTDIARGIRRVVKELTQKNSYKAIRQQQSPISTRSPASMATLASGDLSDWLISILNDSDKAQVASKQTTPQPTAMQLPRGDFPYYLQEANAAQSRGDYESEIYYLEQMKKVKPDQGDTKLWKDRMAEAQRNLYEKSWTNYK